jgi:polyisoprenoid-binding protein YceI
MKYRIITMAFVVSFVSALALASDSWTLDTDTSYVRLFQGSRANPALVNTGVARVTGRVELDPRDLNHSTIDLSIYPAGENWGHALNPEGVLLTGYVPDASDHTLLTFKSKHILRTENSELEVIGDITLSRVERTVTAIPSEGYAGPEYGDPVIHTDMREVAFLFPSVSVAPLSVPLTPAALQNRMLEIVGSARIGREDFPGLSAAIKDTNWQSVVRNKVCIFPSTGREDYSGAVCKGTVIAATRDDTCHPGTVGEDYSGPLCTPATGDQTTIVLDLKFLHTATDSSARMLYRPSTTVGNR